MTQNYLLIDIGNSAAKLGFFSGGARAYLSLPRKLADWERPLTQWFRSTVCTSVSWEECQAHVSSVCPELWDRLRPMLGSISDIKFWEDRNVPIPVWVDNKNAVGSDRLFSALYAAASKPAKRPAIVCNVGTAQTVDVVSPEGVFLGGQIIPGLSSGLMALNLKTAFLPKIDRLDENIIATPFGKNTAEAMQFGAVNLACGIIERTRKMVKKEFNRAPIIYISAGAGKIICNNLQYKAQFVEQMTLQGMYQAVKLQE